ncbi:MAG: response regulator transcription factor [Ruminococcaceae bacterium]|nr:response regulator transcription factor [Oscillospiraceae bacterium]
MNNNKYKILLVEDEENILNFITALLEANDYQVISAKSYANAKIMYASHVPDLVILDLGLPDKDGSTLLKEIRATELTPVIVLSARNEEREKVKLLDMGANDYVTKPFGSDELLARVRTALRNSRHSTNKGHLPGGKFAVGELTIDYDARQVFIAGEEIKLTQTEYNIVAFLSENCEKMMTYAAIIKAVWREYPSDAGIKKLQVNMANIRKKFGVRLGESSYITNELGVGYRMNGDK